MLEKHCTMVCYCRSLLNFMLSDVTLAAQNPSWWSIYTGKLPGEAGQAGLLLESSLLIIYEHNHYINSSFKILYLILLADVFVTF